MAFSVSSARCEANMEMQDLSVSNLEFRPSQILWRQWVVSSFAEPSILDTTLILHWGYLPEWLIRCPWSTSLHIPRLYHTNNSFVIRKILTFFLPVLEATWCNISTTLGGLYKFTIYTFIICNRQMSFSYVNTWHSFLAHLPFLTHLTKC